MTHEIYKERDGAVVGEVLYTLDECKGGAVFGVGEINIGNVRLLSMDSDAHAFEPVATTIITKEVPVKKVRNRKVTEAEFDHCEHPINPGDEACAYCGVTVPDAMDEHGKPIPEEYFENVKFSELGERNPLELVIEGDVSQVKAKLAELIEKDWRSEEMDEKWDQMVGGAEEKMVGLGKLILEKVGGTIPVELKNVLEKAISKGEGRVVSAILSADILRETRGKMLAEAMFATDTVLGGMDSLLTNMPYLERLLEGADRNIRLYQMPNEHDVEVFVRPRRMGEVTTSIEMNDSVKERVLCPGDRVFEAVQLSIDENRAKIFLSPVEFQSAVDLTLVNRTKDHQKGVDELGVLLGKRMDCGNGRQLLLDLGQSMGYTMPRAWITSEKVLPSLAQYEKSLRQAGREVTRISRYGRDELVIKMPAGEHYRFSAKNKNALLVASDEKGEVYPYTEMNRFDLMKAARYLGVVENLINVK